MALVGWVQNKNIGMCWVMSHHAKAIFTRSLQRQVVEHLGRDPREGKQGASVQTLHWTHRSVLPIFSPHGHNTKTSFLCRVVDKPTNLYRPQLPIKEQLDPLWCCDSNTVKQTKRIPLCMFTQIVYYPLFTIFTIIRIDIWNHSTCTTVLYM